jgi:hypothetical protein
MLKPYFIKIMTFSILFSFLLFAGCSSDKELLSNWTDQEITIDGEISDWQNNLQYFPDDNIALGFKNDNKYLYICLTTNDLTKIFPMFRSGFIIWFEPENSGKTIGIKYPFHDILTSDERMPPPNDQMNGGENREDLINKMLLKQNEILILNEDKNPVTDFPIENKEGIKAKLGYHSDSFIYELKVPLSVNKYAYQISAAPGEKLKIKFETEESDRKNFKRGNGMMMPPEGGEGGERGGGFGGERQHPEGGRQRMDRGSFKPIDFSTEITLGTK